MAAGTRANPPASAVQEAPVAMSATMATASTAPAAAIQRNCCRATSSPRANRTAMQPTATTTCSASTYRMTSRYGSNAASAATPSGLSRGSGVPCVLGLNIASRTTSPKVTQTTISYLRQPGPAGAPVGNRSSSRTSPAYGASHSHPAAQITASTPGHPGESATTAQPASAFLAVPSRNGTTRKGTSGCPGLRRASSAPTATSPVYPAEEIARDSDVCGPVPESPGKPTKTTTVQAASATWTTRAATAVLPRVMPNLPEARPA
jgi:hypothetical protein